MKEQQSHRKYWHI